ncbi:Pre-mRNA-splicing factor syf2 [Neolecta irregularis DAH-3]|uniref:Pre-mRNA-splicing factor SYF2 n=1 Tax=Neolecta irregularis (strain DAH-3) TaxID=1198029 RepID=A0A1U7LS03_NEOID|nr:Pre-mRNA-splicing factor syf2 [Neolecta irregularis DAH-3]|eukprot:OLL25424.1 Pre-mRNA-splicing factor syf2 [Neolecta irregularis DAH-3]
MPPRRKGRKAANKQAAATISTKSTNNVENSSTIVQVSSTETKEAITHDKDIPQSTTNLCAEITQIAAVTAQVSTVDDSFDVSIQSTADIEVKDLPITVAEGKANNRLEKLKQLRSRMLQSAKDNRQAVYSEHQRLKVDPRLESRLERQKGEAELKLAKQDALEAGEDFERKRAWDWSIEESQAWDKKMEKKKRMIEGALFSDYTQESNKAYKREMKRFKPDIVNYERERAEALSKGQIVINGEGELMAIDADRNFYRDANSLGFFENKPSKAAVDRLVDDIEKGEKQREKNRRKRDEDGDITYINDRNKKFNERVARHYDKYTKEIRDSFERGTAL